ncbi:hypothetical protein QR680_019159 [Steinernema hermaphroditum]|uniref:SET domain-containing protein n=1 Tax=Steinernema hermaphroditum TaxID=289476 RepID=A0AA39HL51_9BILA|nr:hypothetical protein QR680_019159 [Steinernema hermaphroditum]
MALATIVTCGVLSANLPVGPEPNVVIQSRMVGNHIEVITLDSDDESASSSTSEVITLDSDSNDEDSTPNGRIPYPPPAPQKKLNAKGTEGFANLPNKGCPFVIEDLVYRDERMKEFQPKYPIRIINRYNGDGLDRHFKYSEINCYPDDVDHKDTFAEFCNCEDGDCVANKCPCAKHSTITIEDGKIAPRQIGSIQCCKDVLVECSSQCKCKGRCDRKYINDAIQHRVEIIMTEKTGFSCFVREGISAGTFVCEFVGHIYTDEESIRDNRVLSYTYSVNRMDDEDELVIIDPFYHGNVSRFFNHSCDENLRPFRFFKYDRIARIPHLGFYASRNIAANEELTINYGIEWWTEAIESKKLDFCYCGAEHCLLPDPTNKACKLKEIERKITRLKTFHGGYESLSRQSLPSAHRERPSVECRVSQRSVAGVFSSTMNPPGPSSSAHADVCAVDALSVTAAQVSLADSDGSEEERVWRERKTREKKRSLPTRPSGFWLFANSLFGESVTRKKDYQGLNRVFLTATFGKLRTKMIECAQPLWNKMSEEEKKVWQKRAQSVKLVAGTSAAEKNRKGKKVPKTLPSEDEDEDFFDGEVDEFDIGAVQVERETSGPAVDSRSKTKRDSDAEKIGLWLRSFGQKHLADVKRARFLFASVQTYGDLDRKVIPAEIALVEFSLRHGILDLYSTVIGPWDVPNDVLRFRANFNCKETHKIPLDLKTMLKMGIKFTHKKDVIGEILGRVEPLVAQNQGLKVGLYREGVFEFDDEFEIRSSTLRDGKINAATVVQHLSDTKPILPGNDAEHRWIVCLDHELDWVVRAMEHLKSDTGLEYEHFPTAPDRFVSVSAFVDAFKRHVQEDAKAIDYANLFASLGTPKFGDEETSTPSEANNRLFCPFHRKVLNPCCASMAACRACFGIFSTLKDAYDLDLIN